jgi:hypothetical protein
MAARSIGHLDAADAPRPSKAQRGFAVPVPIRVQPYRLAKPERPVRIHSASPAGGGFAPFTPADLRRAAQNFDRYQKPAGLAYPKPKAAYVPAADIGIGHEPGQEMARAILNRTDLPSCGYPTRVWSQGPDLYAELDGVPEPIAKMCESGEFSEVSAEIYPDWITPDGRHIGPLLKRISLLGATQPRQKGLGGIPRMVYSFSEPPPPNARNRTQQVAILFSEGPFAMNKEQALAVLQAAGIDTTVWQNVDDAAVVAFATYVQSQQPAPVAPVQQFAEINRMVAATVGQAVTPVLSQMREMANAFGAIQTENTRQECLTFAESEKKRLFPFERDAKGDKYIVARLMKMAADARKSEMESIRARPEMKFAEQMGQDGSGDGQARGSRDDGQPPTEERRQALLGMTPLGTAHLARLKASKN